MNELMLSVFFFQEMSWPGVEVDRQSGLFRWMALKAWWRHQMETFSAVLALCAGNSPVPGEFPTQRPVTRSFDVFFDLRLNKQLSKQWWGWWFETIWDDIVLIMTISCSLWRAHYDWQFTCLSSQRQLAVPAMTIKLASWWLSVLSVLRDVHMLCKASHSMSIKTRCPHLVMRDWFVYWLRSCKSSVNKRRSFVDWDNEKTYVYYLLKTTHAQRFLITWNWTHIIWRHTWAENERDFTNEFTADRNIGSGIGLVLSGAIPLPEPMLTYHQ